MKLQKITSNQSLNNGLDGLYALVNAGSIELKGIHIVHYTPSEISKPDVIKMIDTMSMITAWIKLVYTNELTTKKHITKTKTTIPIKTYKLHRHQLTNLYLGQANTQQTRKVINKSEKTARSLDNNWTVETVTRPLWQSQCTWKMSMLRKLLLKKPVMDKKP